MEGSSDGVAARQRHPVRTANETAPTVFCRCSAKSDKRKYRSRTKDTRTEELLKEAH